MGTPVPPPLLVPDGFDFPSPGLEVPNYKEFQWVAPPRKPRRGVPDLKGPELDGATPPAELQGPASGQATVKATSADPALPPAPAFKEVRQFTVPIIEKDIPLPAPEILVTAVTTAGVSSVTAVAGTLVATSLFKQVVKLAKPVTKALAKKLAKIRKKPPPLSWARARRLERRPGRSR